MSHLPTLAHLLEVRHKQDPYEDFKLADIWENEGLESLDVRAFYDYEPSDYTDHPYGSTSAREYHGAVINLTSVITLAEGKVYDEDGDQVVRVIPKGSELMNDPIWKESFTAWFEDQIAQSLGES